MLHYTVTDKHFMFAECNAHMMTCFPNWLKSRIEMLTLAYILITSRILVPSRDTTQWMCWSWMNPFFLIFCYFTKKFNEWCAPQSITWLLLYVVHLLACHARHCSLPSSRWTCFNSYYYTFIFISFKGKKSIKYCSRSIAVIATTCINFGRYATLWIHKWSFKGPFSKIVDCWD